MSAQTARVVDLSEYRRKRSQTTAAPPLPQPCFLWVPVWLWVPLWPAG